jgi:hypothetical protein
VHSIKKKMNTGPMVEEMAVDLKEMDIMILRAGTERKFKKQQNRVCSILRPRPHKSRF